MAPAKEGGEGWKGTKEKILFMLISSTSTGLQNWPTDGEPWTRETNSWQNLDRFTRSVSSLKEFKLRCLKEKTPSSRKYTAFLVLAKSLYNSDKTGLLCNVHFRKKSKGTVMCYALWRLRYKNLTILILLCNKTPTLSGTTLSDLYVVLCFVLHQYPVSTACVYHWLL